MSDPTALMAELRLALTRDQYCDGTEISHSVASGLLALIAQQTASIEAVTKERDEARAYLKAFCRACIDSDFERNPVGVHEANPSLGWTFQLDDMDVCPQRHVTGGQVRRAMEIVGFDKLKIEPAARTISDELSENREAARKAKAALTAAEAERDRLVAEEREACLRIVEEHFRAEHEAGGAYIDDIETAITAAIRARALSTAKERGDG